MSADIPLPALPSQFGRFQLLDRIALGGMAEIFKAKMTGAAGFEKIVVIKRILPHLAADKQFVDMFIDEAKLTVHLVHPKIVQVLEFGEVDGQYYIALEFVEGLDCLALLRGCAHKRVRLPPAIAAHIGHEVLDALDYAHRAADPEGRLLGIVHRDISPSNVFISRRGDIKLGDFGIAHASERQSKTQAGTLKGKYGYMSPEQVVGGKLDGRSDLFAVGIVLAEMLMGRRLFTSPNDLDVLLMVRDVKLERLQKYGTDIPAELRDILIRALRRVPNERWQHAGDFRDALADWLFSNGTRVTPSDVGSFLRSLYVEGTQDSEIPQVKQGTIAGHSTKAAALAADLKAEIARREVQRGTHIPRGDTPPPQPSPIAAPEAPSRKPSRLGNKGAAIPERPSPLGPTRQQQQASNSPADWGLLSRPGSASARPPGMLDDGIEPASGPKENEQDDREAPFELDLLDAEVTPELSSSNLEPMPDDDLEGLDIDVEMTPTPPPHQDETTPASLAEAFQVLESTPQPLDDLQSTGRIELADQVDRAFDALGSDNTPNPTIGRTMPPGALRPASRPPESAAREAAKFGPPDEEGDLQDVSTTRVFTRLAAMKETGLLRVECGGAVKDIYLSGGAPEYVTSNLARELLGEYLVAQGVITSGELSMALAMMPRFGGKLGDTLVGLSLMRPLDVFRHLTRQVRDKLVDVFTWARGHWKYWRGRTNQREAFPLGIDPFEIVGAGVVAIPEDLLQARYKPLGSATPRARPGLLVDPDAFRVGPMPRELLARLDGGRSLGQWMRLYASEQELIAFLRTLYLLVETDLASLD
jgi:eukaryotic-like serine/threonine-protein kinase